MQFWVSYRFFQRLAHKYTGIFGVILLRFISIAINYIYSLSFIDLQHIWLCFYDICYLYWKISLENVHFILPCCFNINEFFLPTVWPLDQKEKRKSSAPAADNEQPLSSVSSAPSTTSLPGPQLETRWRSHYWSSYQHRPLNNLWTICLFIIITFLGAVVASESG